MEESAPIVLELAPLPREQLGPFLVLGVAKDADWDQIEAAWAERVKASRRNLVRVPLEDINWAREVLSDPERRFHAASASLNLDIDDGTLQRLALAFGLVGRSGPGWTPQDAEKSLVDYTPQIPVPDTAAIAQGIALPEISLELPAVNVLLRQFLPESLDPWSPCNQLVHQASDRPTPEAE